MKEHTRATHCVPRLRQKSISARLSRLAIALACLALGGLVAPLEAAEPEPPVTPPRLAFVTGEASFWRPGAESWAPALVNTAMAPGDRLRTAPNSSVELQIGARSWVRAGETTTVELTGLEHDSVHLEVTEGRVALDLFGLPVGLSVRVATPNAALGVASAGYYRVDVGLLSTGFVARREGSATVVPREGNPVILVAGEEIVIGATDAPLVQRGTAPSPDRWDDWNDGRSDRIFAANLPGDVPPDFYGVEELGEYGDWHQTSEYGWTWAPSGLPTEWVPYSAGRWMREPHYGWTWVDDAPWGWAPFHYGRWVFVGRHWAWAPGPIFGRPVYAPALVAFLDSGPYVQVAFSGPTVSWVPLGWGEPLIPWWGPTGFVGVRWWDGWWGPRVKHHHAHHRHGAVAVPHDHFRKGKRIHPTRRLPPDNARRLGSAHGPIPARPSPHRPASEERPPVRRPDPPAHRGTLVAARPAPGVERRPTDARPSPERREPPPRAPFVGNPDPPRTSEPPRVKPRERTRAGRFNGSGPRSNTFANRQSFGSKPSSQPRERQSFSRGSAPRMAGGRGSRGRGR